MFDPILAERFVESAKPPGAFFAATIFQTVDLVFAASGVLLVILYAFRCFRCMHAPWFPNAPERANRFGDDSVMLAVGIYFLTAVLLGAIAGAGETETPSVTRQFFVASGLNLAGLGVCGAIVTARFRGGCARMVFGAGGARGSAWMLSIAGTVASIGVCPLIALGVVVAVRWVAPEFDFSVHPTLLTLRGGEASSWLVAGLWISAVVMAPLAEEFFFRGIVQTYLTRVLHGRWRAIGVTSLAFGVVHSGQPHAVLPLVLFSILLGFVYERSGALMFPLLIHAAFNAKAMLWETLAAGGVV